MNLFFIVIVFGSMPALMAHPVAVVWDMLQTDILFGLLALVVVLVLLMYMLLKKQDE